MIVIQARIEFDNLRHSESWGLTAFLKDLFASKSKIAAETGNDNDTANRFGFTISLLRVSLALGIVFVFILVNQLTKGTDYNTYNILAADALIGVLLPFLFVYHHKGIWRVFRQSLARIFL